MHAHVRGHNVRTYHTHTHTHTHLFSSLQAFNVLSAIIKHRDDPGVKVQSKVLEVRNVDVSLATVTTVHVQASMVATVFVD